MFERYMDTFVIDGGRPLSGKIKVDGSKNAALPLLAACMMVDSGVTTLENVPPLKDIDVMLKLLASLGAQVEYDSETQIARIDASKLSGTVASYELVSQMRGAFVALGPLLARMGEATVSLPGGCSLGARPVDYHIKGLRAMKAEVTERDGYVTARRTSGCDSTVCFDRPTHTGTENIMFAATLGEGRTTIINAACDPEVVDVANFLNAAGGKVSGAGTGQVEVQAVSRLRPITHTVSGDRLVAGTFLFAAAATGGKVEVAGVAPDSLTMVLEKLSEMGCKVNVNDSSINLSAPKRLRASSAVT
ncbi:MAG: UDP-N-acetylglucosamine 1-carboxyvinyltransferase, partial [Candidatus Zixiibacteriota bacterium]